MKNSMVYMIVLSLFVGVFAGCNVPSKDKDMKTSKNEAYKDWAKSRIELYQQLANDNYKAGRLDDAKEKIKEVIKLDTNNEQARMFLAKINIEQGLFDVACKDLEYIISQNSQSYEAFYLLGIALEHKGNLDQSLVNYEHAAQLNPREVAPVLAAAEVLVKMDRASEGLMLIERRMGDSGDKPDVYELAGRISMIMGEYQKAVDYFQKACDVDYKNKRYPEMLAQAQKESGDAESAGNTMRRILRSRNKNEYKPWMFIFLGDCDMATNNPEEALLAYRKASQLDRKNVAAWVSMAQACIVMEKYVIAANATVEALKIKPNDLQANQMYAYTLLKLNRAKQASDRLEQVAKLYPQNSTVCYLLARAYQMQGLTAQARQQLDKAMQAQPESRLAKQMLAKGY